MIKLSCNISQGFFCYTLFPIANLLFLCLWSRVISVWIWGTLWGGDFLEEQVEWGKLNGSIQSFGQLIICSWEIDISLLCDIWKTWIIVKLPQNSPRHQQKVHLFFLFPLKTNLHSSQVSTVSHQSAPAFGHLLPKKTLRKGVPDCSTLTRVPSPGGSQILLKAWSEVGVRWREQFSTGTLTLSWISRHLQLDSCPALKV